MTNFVENLAEQDCQSVHNPHPQVFGTRICFCSLALTELQLQHVEQLRLLLRAESQMDVVESLKAELGQVNEKLAALEQMKNDRATLTAQASRLTKAIAMLSGEPVVRKPMSPEAKERIRAGLEKARAAKVAAGTAKPSTTPAQPQPVATGQAQGDTGKKPANEKGSGRGAN